MAITNLNGLLADVYNRYVALDEDEFKKYYNVTTSIVEYIIEKMKAADPYFNKYCGAVQFSGSHYDRLRINKPDEFDMVIIISLPVNMQEDQRNPEKSDVVLEPKCPGYIQLKMGQQFQNLPIRDRPSDRKVNRTAYQWLDERNYLLRSKFLSWFKSVVDRGLGHNPMTGPIRRELLVGDVPYTICLTSSGPAITLLIENQSTRFKVDVDLVPALKFPESRWPICRGYREIPPRCKKDIWLVVPKPNKTAINQFDADRSWRLSLYLQERELMYDTNNLRQTIRLIKKLRDSLEMHKIASYFIKNLFCLEIEDGNHAANFWSGNNPATLFEMMVRRFHQALVLGNIKYFWNKESNLLENIDRSTLTGYANRLYKLIQVLDSPSQYKMVAKFLLTPSEFQEYNRYLHI